MTCKHAHGDAVTILSPWVCGQCFAKLPERPKRYTANLKIPSDWDGKTHNGPPQEISWQAEIRKSEDGTTLGTFLRSVARRISHKSGMSREDAYEAALEALKMLEVEFGNPDYDWSRIGAIDLADEEMSYWDHEEAKN